MSQRPKLKRETAQDIEDPEIDSSGDQRMVHHLSPNIFVKGNKNRLIHQKSAPGTPLSPKKIHYSSSRTPSRTPSDESWTSGFLSVPNQRLRGSSFSGDSEFSSRKFSTSFRVSSFKCIHFIRQARILNPYLCLSLKTFKSIYQRQLFIPEYFICFQIFLAKYLQTTFVAKL